MCLGALYHVPKMGREPSRQAWSILGAERRGLFSGLTSKT